MRLSENKRVRTPHGTGTIVDVEGDGRMRRYGVKLDVIPTIRNTKPYYYFPEELTPPDKE